VVAEKVNVNSIRFHALSVTVFVDVTAVALSVSTIASLPAEVSRILAVLVAPDRKLTKERLAVGLAVT